MRRLKVSSMIHHERRNPFPSVCSLQSYYIGTFTVLHILKTLSTWCFKPSICLQSLHCCSVFCLWLEAISCFFVICLVTTQLLMSLLSAHYKHPGFVIGLPVFVFIECVRNWSWVSETSPKTRQLFDWLFKTQVMDLRLECTCDVEPHLNHSCWWSKLLSTRIAWSNVRNSEKITITCRVSSCYHVAVKFHHIRNSNWGPGIQFE